MKSSEIREDLRRIESKIRRATKRTGLAELPILANENWRFATGKRRDEQIQSTFEFLAGLKTDIERLEIVLKFQ